MVELRGISKYFPSNGVMALKNADLTLSPGEIHVLLGENGSGKSTLMHILAGYIHPSTGTILIGGRERRFFAPADALALGIGMLRQHPGFIRGFKVWEDCILGAERPRNQRGPRSMFFDPGLSRKRVQELSDQWNFDLPLDKKAETLTVSQRQKAAVLALLLRDVKWFIFDEPTAVLTPGETKNLFELFKRLRGEGRGIILITHKTDEALSVADRVTVMRNGVTQEINTRREIDLRTLSANQHERAPSALPRTSGVRRHISDSAPILEIKNLRIEPPGLPFIRNVNLRLMPGKILGIAGVRDGGLETLELAIAGFLERSSRVHGKSGGGFFSEGSVTLNGRDITGKGVRAFREAGGAYLGADRLGGNLAAELPMYESLIIHVFRRSRRGLGIFLNSVYLNSWCKKIMDMAGIDRPVSGKPASFSGGMLQRILLAREFTEEASLLVLAEAGSGLDQFNRAALAEDLKAHTGRGAAALLFSTDMEELNSLADEIMVLKNGTFSAADKAEEGISEI